MDSTQLNRIVNRSNRSVYSAFLTTFLHPFDIVTVGASGRFDKYSDESAPSLGAKLTLRPLSFLDLFSEYGRSYRFPTFQESSWADSAIQRPSPIRKEEHTLLRAGFSISLNETNALTVTGFNRNVHNAIIFQPSVTRSGSPAIRILNVSQVRTRGVSGSLNLCYGPFEFAGTALYQDYVESDTSKDLIPNLVMSGELTYRNKFFNEALDTKFGVRMHYMNRQRGTTFNPRMMLYEENTEANVGMWTRLDAFAILKVGNAYITLSYENLLDANYTITPVYPMPDRSFRLGVNWVFID
jgi:outer membrane cobalamin receptor